MRNAGRQEGQEGHAGPEGLPTAGPAQAWRRLCEWALLVPSFCRGFVEVVGVGWEMVSVCVCIVLFAWLIFVIVVWLLGVCFCCC